MPEYSPSFIKVDPVTGLTFYDFDGHISARGLDLPWYDPTAADPEHALPWQDQAQIKWKRSNNQFVEGAIRTEPGGTLVLFAYDDPGQLNPAEVVANAGGTEANALWASEVLIRQDGTSTYAKNRANYGCTEIYGPYGGATYSLGAGSGLVAAPIQLWPTGTYSAFVPMGAVFNPTGTWTAQNAVTWAYRVTASGGNDFIEIAFENTHPTVATPQFQFFFCMMAFRPHV